MSAPAYVSTTLGPNGAGSVAVTMPTTAADDILLAIIVNGGATTSLAPAGSGSPYNGGPWNLIDGAAGTAQWGGVYWSRATQNHAGQGLQVTGGTDSTCLDLIRVSGCRVGESPVDTNFSSGNFASSNMALSSFNTTTIDTLVFFIAAMDDNIAPGTATKGGVNMTRATSFPHSNPTGSDSSTDAWYATQAAVGATGAFANTHASSLSKELVAFALCSVSNAVPKLMSRP